jgi:hypothetical protein
VVVVVVVVVFLLKLYWPRIDLLLNF